MSDRLTFAPVETGAIDRLARLDGGSTVTVSRDHAALEVRRQRRVTVDAVDEDTFFVLDDGTICRLLLDEFEFAEARRTGAKLIAGNLTPLTPEQLAELGLGANQYSVRLRDVGDPLALRIIAALGRGESTAGQLATALQDHPAVVATACRALAAAEVLRESRAPVSGEPFYSLNAADAIDRLSSLRRHLNAALLAATGGFEA